MESTNNEKNTQRHCTECGQIRNPGIENRQGCDHDHDRLASVGKNFCPDCGKRLR